MGTLVVLDEEIHAARFVRKTNTQNPAAFRSEPAGPVGWLSEGAPHIATRPSGRRQLALRPGGEVRPVALFTVALGDDGRLLPKIPELGYEGPVIEALGGGHVPSVMVEPLAALAREMPVVLASRTGSGKVLRRTYGYPGSETDLLNRGLISTGSLDGLKARLLLSLLLRPGAGREKAEDLLGNWLGHRC